MSEGECELKGNFEWLKKQFNASRERAELSTFARQRIVQMPTIQSSRWDQLFAKQDTESFQAIALDPVKRLQVATKSADNEFGDGWLFELDEIIEKGWLQ